MKLHQLMEQDPEIRKEVRELVEINNIPWKDMASYLKRLEDMIEHNASRRELLEVIDNHYGLTMWFRADGLIEEDEHWYDDFLTEND